MSVFKKNKDTCEIVELNINSNNRKITKKLKKLFKSQKLFKLKKIFKK